MVSYLLSIGCTITGQTLCLAATIDVKNMAIVYESRAAKSANIKLNDAVVSYALKNGNLECLKYVMEHLPQENVRAMAAFVATIIPDCVRKEEIIEYVDKILRM
jgi:hypothetical protein